jgi:hypothetical protein
VPVDDIPTVPLEADPLPPVGRSPSSTSSGWWKDAGRVLGVLVARSGLAAGTFRGPAAQLRRSAVAAPADREPDPDITAKLARSSMPAHPSHQGVQLGPGHRVADPAPVDTVEADAFLPFVR